MKLRGKNEALLDQFAGKAGVDVPNPVDASAAGNKKGGDVSGLIGGLRDYANAQSDGPDVVARGGKKRQVRDLYGSLTGGGDAKGMSMHDMLQGLLAHQNQAPTTATPPTSPIAGTVPMPAPVNPSVPPVPYSNNPAPPGFSPLGPLGLLGGMNPGQQTQQGMQAGFGPERPQAAPAPTYIGAGVVPPSNAGFGMNMPPSPVQGMIPGAEQGASPTYAPNAASPVNQQQARPLGGLIGGSDAMNPLRRITGQK